MNKLEPKTILVIDGNNMAYRAFYKFSQLSTMGGKNTSIVYGIPFILKSLIEKWSPDMVIAVFDGSRSKYRLKLLPEYKGTRGNKLDFDREDFLRQKGEVINGLRHMGIPVVLDPKEEADDMIYLVRRTLLKQGPNNTIIVVSSDKDFNQLATDKNTVIFNPSSGEKITKYNCKKIRGYEPGQLVDYLTLTGDSSDNIPGMPGIGEKRATGFLDKYGSIKAYLNGDTEEKMFPKKELKAVWKRNRELISLSRFYVKHMTNKRVAWFKNDPFPKFDLSGYRTYCIENQLTSFNEASFMQVYKSLNTRMLKLIKNK